MKINFWQARGDSFDRYYRQLRQFDPKNYVKMFLNSRSEVLIHMIKNEKLGQVLDVGCGSGIQMKLIVSQSKYVCGIDISKKMISFAKNELKEIKKSKWEVKEGDANKIPYKNSTFNTVISLGLLDYVKSLPKVLNEFSRVLKKRGVLIISIPKKPSLFSFLRTSFGNTIKEKLFGLPPVINIYSRNELYSILKNSHFKVLNMKSLWTTMWVIKAVNLYG